MLRVSRRTAVFDLLRKGARLNGVLHVFLLSYMLCFLQRDLYCLRVKLRCAFKSGRAHVLGAEENTDGRKPLVAPTARAFSEELSRIGIIPSLAGFLHFSVLRLAPIGSWDDLRPLESAGRQFESWVSESCDFSSEGGLGTPSREANLRFPR